MGRREVSSGLNKLFPVVCSHSNFVLRIVAVSKAIDRVYEMSLDQENFDLFGNDMIQCFYDVATVTGEPIRQKTLKYVEHLANRWKYTIMQRGWKEAEDGKSTPYEVIDAGMVPSFTVCIEPSSSFLYH